MTSGAEFCDEFGQLLLEVADNGVGLPPGYDPTAAGADPVTDVLAPNLDVADEQLGEVDTSGVKPLRTERGPS